MIEDQSKEVPIPLIKLELLEALDSRFPSTPARLEDRTREVWFKAGQRATVEWLHSIYRQQQEEDVLKP
jgi:hypothetical protein